MTLKSVKHELADTVQALKSGSMEPKTAQALVYALSALISVIKGADLEEKIRRLERRDHQPGVERDMTN